MANEAKDILQLTVPRRHVLVAAATASTEERRPILNHICLRPANGEQPVQARGKLRVIATNGHRIVSMEGGRWEGDWPAAGKITLPPKLFSKKRAKGILDTDIEITVLDDRTVRVLDPATASETSRRVTFLQYPDTDRVFAKYERFAIARAGTCLDARYLEEMGRLGSVFSDKPTRVVRILLRRRQVRRANGRPASWVPVFTMKAESGDGKRTMKTMLMGTRGCA